MQAKPEVEAGAARFVPNTRDLAKLRNAAKSCRGCDLYRRATQTVFGQGAPHARVVLVGEQPGDQEDRQGLPFVGPAGGLLDRALAEAGISKRDVYVTNAVKHFKFEQRGKRRIHKKPGRTEIVACRPWLAAELAAVKPRILVCLGATASQALMGSSFSLMKERGKFFQTDWAPKLLVTIHPSAALRAIEHEDRQRLFRLLVSDFKLVARELANGARRARPPMASAASTPPRDSTRRRSV